MSFVVQPQILESNVANGCYKKKQCTKIKDEQERREEEMEEV